MCIYLFLYAMIHCAQTTELAFLDLEETNAEYAMSKPPCLTSISTSVTRSALTGVTIWNQGSRHPPPSAHHRVLHVIPAVSNNTSNLYTNDIDKSHISPTTKLKKKKGGIMQSRTFLQGVPEPGLGKPITALALIPIGGSASSVWCPCGCFWTILHFF